MILLRGALLGVLCFDLAWATSDRQPNIAVLSFRGDETVTAAQLEFMTGKFTSELVNTGAFNVLERNRMDAILKEQGFQQSGACTSNECQVQIGQLLGVENLVAGHIVRFGREYAFRAEYIDVGTGKILYTVELSRKGELEEVYSFLCKEGAQQLTQKLNSPSPTLSAISVIPGDAIPGVPQKRPFSIRKKIALGLMGSALLAAGGTAYFVYQSSDAADRWDAAEANRDAGALKRADSDLTDANLSANVAGGTTLGLAVIGIALYFWPE